jgi:hypothetical protein
LIPHLRLRLTCWFVAYPWLPGHLFICKMCCHHSYLCFCQSNQYVRGQYFCCDPLSMKVEISLNCIDHKPLGLF